ncbi:Protein of unknown function (DUF3007) [Leptolyngbyaceae cyanobacterium JSC-12]|nr:Protein of unknown function (DUF3007) [Leptolyngbyaceae cyanobacterium JSC-12]
MRRIDVIGIGVGVLAAGGIAFVLLQVAGLDSIHAGIWAQALLVGGLVGWLLTYVFRAVTGSMTYHQQRRDYEEAILQKRLEELTPEELAALQAEVEAENAVSKSTQ